MSECTHSKVIVYSHQIFSATRYEPAEYEEKIVCSECGEVLDFLPEKAKVKDAMWYQEYEEE